MEAIVWKAAVENDKQQEDAKTQRYEETYGKKGHRDPDFLERARAAEAAR